MNGKKAKDLRKAARYLVNNKVEETKTPIPYTEYRRTHKQYVGIRLTHCQRWVYQNLKKDFKAGKFTITSKAA